MLIKILFSLILFLGSAFEAQEPQVPLPSVTAPIEAPASPLQEDSFPAKALEPSYENAFLKMILTLGGLLLLVFFTLWAIRKLSNGRMGTFGSAKKIKILEKKPISPKTAIYHLELDGRRIFITESQLEIKTILDPHEVEMD